MHVSSEIIWEKLEKIDDKLSGPSGIYAINARLGGIETRLDKIETCLNDVEKSKLDTPTFQWFFGILITALIAAFSTIGWWMPLLRP